MCFIIKHYIYNTVVRIVSSVSIYISTNEIPHCVWKQPQLPLTLTTYT